MAGRMMTSLNITDLVKVVGGVATHSTPGMDRISTGAADDYVFAAAGNDTVDLGYGNDTASGDGGNDSIRGQEGADLLAGGAGNDTIGGGADGDSLLGGDGNDALFGASGGDSIEGELGDDLLDGGAGDAAADTLVGGAGHDSFAWAPGDGSDSVQGGVGLDKILLYGVSLDALQAGLVLSDPGLTMHVSGKGGVITFTDHRGEAVGFSGQLTIGSETLVFQDVESLQLVGDPAARAGYTELPPAAAPEPGAPTNDRLTGGAGQDSLLGGGGDDSLVGRDGSDLLEGHSGNDTLDGGLHDQAADTLIGGDGDDVFRWDWGNGHDVVQGGSGYNVLDLTGLRRDDIIRNMVITDSSLTMVAGDSGMVFLDSDGKPANFSGQISFLGHSLSFTDIAIIRFQAD